MQVIVAMATMPEAIFGDVVWDTKSQNFILPTSSSEQAFTFNFENKGPNSIRINSATTSCGCTITSFPAEIVKAGVSGEIVGSYKPGSRRGLNRVSIIVKGSEIIGDKLHPFDETLSVVLDAPEIVKINPGMTLWKRNDPLLEKVVNVEIATGIPMELRILSLSNESFDIELNGSDQSGSFKLKSKPKSTSGSCQTMVTLEGLSPGGAKMRFYAHFVVR